MSITKIVSEKTSDEPENENIESRSSVKSIKDRIVGMGGQGMPLILPGMKLTKPS